jgi:GAF domain-containing protein
MSQALTQRLRECVGLDQALDCALEESLALSDTRLGNIQVVDWQAGYLTIEAQRGFDTEFLEYFTRVPSCDGTACARALRNRETIVIDDVMVDRDFTPFRDAACRAGFRSVQSRPLISTNGALVGVMSAHFDKRRRMSARTTHLLEDVARATADAIIVHRARSLLRAQQEQAADLSGELLRRSRGAIKASRDLLSQGGSSPAAEPGEADRHRWRIPS